MLYGYHYRLSSQILINPRKMPGDVSLMFFKIIHDTMIAYVMAI